MIKKLAQFLRFFSDNNDYYWFRIITHIFSTGYNYIVSLFTVTSVFSVVFDFTSTEPVPNYQQIRQQVHDDVTEAVIITTITRKVLKIVTLIFDFVY